MRKRSTTRSGRKNAVAAQRVHPEEWSKIREGPAPCALRSENGVGWLEKYQQACIRHPTVPLPAEGGAVPSIRWEARSWARKAQLPPVIGFGKLGGGTRRGRFGGCYHPTMAPSASEMAAGSVASGPFAEGLLQRMSASGMWWQSQRYNCRSGCRCQ
jgi:hypothetical protein